MKPVGIMQGRLLPPVGDRIQAFPADGWREELTRAREAGLDCVEWIYEEPRERDNPLATERGVEELRRSADEAGVGVWSVCADYYMTRRLVAADGSGEPEAVAHLDRLLDRVAQLGARYVVIPFVDSSSVHSEPGVGGLRRLLPALADLAESHAVELHLETDLAPETLSDLMTAAGGAFLRLNYDSGNSASLGYKAADELPLLGAWIGSFHVKDRLRGGGTVPLGTGDADLPTAVRLALAAGFGGPFILQAARETGLSEVELARRNRRLVDDLQARALAAR